MPDDDTWHVHLHVLGLRLDFAWRPWRRARQLAFAG